MVTLLEGTLNTWYKKIAIFVLKRLFSRKRYEIGPLPWITIRESHICIEQILQSVEIK